MDIEVHTIALRVSKNKQKDIEHFRDELTNLIGYPVGKTECLRIAIERGMKEIRAEQQEFEVPTTRTEKIESLTTGV
jgi:hypothetical protein